METCSGSSSSGSLNLTVDLLRVLPEDGGDGHEGGRGGTAAGEGPGSPQSCSGTMSLLLDGAFEDGGFLEEAFDDGILRVLLLEDTARAGCLPRGAGPGGGPGGGGRSSKSSHLSGRSGIKSSETSSTLMVLLPGGDHLGGGAGGAPGAAAAGGRSCFLTSSSMTFW